MAPVVNVLLSAFPGLSLPPTSCLPLPSDLTCHDLYLLIASLLPVEVAANAFLTSSDNTRIPNATTVDLSDLAQSSCASSQMLSLRLSAPLVGGKGGFGSQLRAAGGRMSSRKRKQNAELATGSARNLDGRRLRTITEAKNLATYLATKPEMDRKEKEERRKRWEQVIELAEQREADMKAGKTADGRRKGISEDWIQEKEDVGDNVKNAVKLAMAAEAHDTARQGDSGSDHSASDSVGEESEEEEPMELAEEDMLRLRREAEAGDADAIWVLHKRLKIPTSYLPKEQAPPRRFAGFDDDLSSSDEDAVDETTIGDKGKAVIRD